MTLMILFLTYSRVSAKFTFHVIELAYFTLIINVTQVTSFMPKTCRLPLKYEFIRICKLIDLGLPRDIICNFLIFKAKCPKFRIYLVMQQANAIKWWVTTAFCASAVVNFGSAKSRDPSTHKRKNNQISLFDGLNKHAIYHLNRLYSSHVFYWLIFLGRQQ